MADTITHKRERTIKELFVGKCWEYLNSNFSKFSQSNQIKIALELCKKDIPQVMEGEIKYTSMEIIRIEQKPLSLDLGEDIPEPIKERMHGRAAQDTTDA
jgi:hypothetical protein